MDENKDILKIIGNNIQTTRKQRKLTQSQLAEKLNVSDKFISLAESRKNADLVLPIL
ncbi:MAG: helix-turn-helix domain-containing protein [Clostridia bacterium]|nr:helix-turn-helix domain-containing protein [Clostridia bacterium]